MAKVDITAGKYVDYLKKVTAKIASEKDYITELDAATGDGDHWANMNTGFTKLMEIEDQLRAASAALRGYCTQAHISRLRQPSGVRRRWTQPSCLRFWRRSFRA